MMIKYEDMTTLVAKPKTKRLPWENLNAQIAVKTPNGISRRETISNIIMQGSVWGSLLCTTTMDKLGQLFYENEDLVYMY